MNGSRALGFPLASSSREKANFFILPFDDFLGEVNKIDASSSPSSLFILIIKD